MRLYDLKTLHMKKCVGIDQNPYFSWKIANDKNDTVQCAYQIQVLCDEECLWDTGKVESEKQSFVEYEGIALSSRTEYKWKVTVWNNYNETAEAAMAFISFGSTKKEQMTVNLHRNLQRIAPYYTIRPMM